MNRNEEYRQLLDELEETPPELEYTMTRVQARNDRSSLIKRIIALPAATLMAIFVTFVILVNTFTSFAMAMSNIPLLSDLAAAVAFSPSLSAAIKNEYVQPIGLEQENSGVTMRIEYVIVDEKQLNVFYTVTSDKYQELWPHRTNVTWPDGSDMESWSLMDGPYKSEAKPEDIRQFTIDFLAHDVPESLHLKLDFYEIIQEFVEVTSENQWEVPDVPPSVATFDFLLTYDPLRVAKGEIIGLNQTIQLGDLTIIIEKAEIYPTHMRLNLQDQPDNAAWLTGLSFDVINDKGQRFSGIGNGINASSISPDDPFMESHRIESPYFSKSKQLSILIDQVKVLDKTDERLKVDLINQTAEHLPEGIRLDKAVKTSQGWELSFLAREFEENHTYSVFNSDFYDEQGTKYSYNMSSTSLATEEIEGEPAYRITFLLPDYFEDTVYLSPQFSRYIQFDPAIEVKIK